MEKQLIPDIRNSRYTPMNTIRKRCRIIQPVLGYRFPKFPVHRRVTIFTILRQLGDVYDWNLWSKSIQNTLHHPHCRNVRPTSPITLFLYRILLPVAVSFGSRVPFSAPDQLQQLGFQCQDKHKTKQKYCFDGENWGEVFLLQLMCRRHCNEEDPLFVWIDIVRNPISPSIHRHLHSLGALHLLAWPFFFTAPSLVREYAKFE